MSRRTFSSRTAIAASNASTGVTAPTMTATITEVSKELTRMGLSHISTYQRSVNAGSSVTWPN